MNRIVDYENLKMQNFQLKNQITDLKNAFDLNRDVLKILSEQTKQKHPQYQIFYQIISRLTGINNQIMLTNIQLLQQKNKIIAENKKLENVIEGLSLRIQQLLNSKDCVSPKQINLQMRDQMKQLRSQIFALNEDYIRKKLEICRLEKIIKEKQIAQMKKPIIPSVRDPETYQKINEKEMDNISKKFQTEGKVLRSVMQKNLQRQNAHLKRLVEELQYRLTLLSRIYEIEPLGGRQQNEQYEVGSNEQPNFKTITQNQLKLLMFALNNTRLSQDSESHALKVTITNRCKQFLKSQKILQRSHSSIF